MALAMRDGCVAFVGEDAKLDRYGPGPEPLVASCADGLGDACAPAGFGVVTKPTPCSPGPALRSAAPAANCRSVLSPRSRASSHTRIRKLFMIAARRTISAGGRW